MIPALQDLDYRMIAAATEWASDTGWRRGMVYIGAELLVFIYPLALLYLWDRPAVRGYRSGARKAVVMSLVSVTVALALKTVVSILLFRDRPFMSHPELLHMSFRVDPASFPSGHSLVSFAVAGSLLWSGYPRLGGWLTGVAFLIAVSRVFAGVHYPSDVFVGSVLGLLASWYLHREASGLKRYLPDE